MEKSNRSVSKFGGIVCFVCFCLIFTFDTLTAQISQGGEPRSFQLTVLEEPEQITMQAVDVQALLAEDQLERESSTPIPPRFGFAHEVGLDIHRHGTWTKLEDGGRLWRLKIHSPGAFSINLIYDDFYLPPETTFFIYNSDKTDVIGAFTELNNKEYSKFSTQPVAGDVSILEYYEPAGVREQVRLRITHVVHAYLNLFNWNHGSENGMGLMSGHGNSLSCNIPVNCSQGNPYQDQKRAVAMILLQNGTRICSGSLLNNVRKNGTPYFLTARHCADANSDGQLSQAEINAIGTWIFMFNYESPGCNNNDGPTYQTVSGATLRAHFAGTDFALLQLSSQPHPTYNVYYLGWSAQNVVPQSSTNIHHPRGDTKKFSFDYNPAVRSTFLGDGTTTGNYWRIELTEGTTEPGSSGAPQLNQNRRVVGQNRGGFAGCPNPSVAKYYGRFDVSWNGGGTNSTRLRNWLDPDNTNTLVLNGMNAPLAVFMDGLWVFNPGTNGQWTAAAYGGTPPYTFTWHRSYSSASGPWTQVGTGTSYSQTVNQEMWLRLRATDSSSKSVETVKWIRLLTCSNPPCPQP